MALAKLPGAVGPAVGLACCNFFRKVGTNKAGKGSRKLQGLFGGGVGSSKDGPCLGAAVPKPACERTGIKASDGHGTRRLQRLIKALFRTKIRDHLGKVAHH